MKKSVKIWIIVFVILLGIADLMALHNIYATDIILYKEYIILVISLFIYIYLAYRLFSRR
ncbi:MAG: hypothetical protein U5L09_20135 [Bacteroidales bacterium]|nr:hypothetical protein [Bacteroidales bacterium]